jgi:predicted DNA-binding protein (UPF0251 family)
MKPPRSVAQVSARLPMIVGTANELNINSRATFSEVLRLRFREGPTQREVGERLGISQTQVSRLMRTSLAHLQAIAAQDEERSLLAA